MIQHPARAQLINNASDFESLLKNENKGIRCLSLCVLLKICKEDKLVTLLEKTFDQFKDMPDSIKIDIIESCKDLCAKFPKKMSEIMSFMWKCLRQRGEATFKEKVIEVMDELVRKTNSYYDLLFEFFCEYIEDPFSPQLTLKIIDILISHCGKVTNPRKYLRFLINRLHLDEAAIRTATIGCLGEMALTIDDLKDDVLNIIEAFCHDLEDEVRARAHYYKMILSGKYEDPKDYLLSATQLNLIQETFQVSFLLKKNRVGHSEDEAALEELLALPTNLESKRYDARQVESVTPEAKSQNPRATAPVYSSENFDPKMKEFFSTHDDFECFGELLISCKPQKIADEDSEYFTTLRKHIFEECVVLEFKINNKDEDHVINFLLRTLLMPLSSLKLQKSRSKFVIS